jgi:hypothetical protein
MTNGDTLETSPEKQMSDRKLLTDVQFRNDAAVTVQVGLHQVIQEAATLTNQLHQTEFGIVVLLIFPEMIGQMIDSVCEQRNL